MNNDRRKQLQKIEQSLEEIEGQIQLLSEEEQDSFYNLPEGIQESERGQKIEENAGELEDIAGEISQIRERLTEF